MIEVDSLAEVETTLRAQGFFEGGRRGLVADVYLGYGLSDALRRRRRATAGAVRAPGRCCADPP